MSREVRVLVQDIVEVGDLPLRPHLVPHREQLEKVDPSDARLEPHDVLDHLGVVAAEQDRRVVLVLDEELHWRLDDAGHCHRVGLVIAVDVVQEVPVVVLGHVHLHWSSEKGRL